MNLRGLVRASIAAALVTVVICSCGEAAAAQSTSCRPADYLATRTVDEAPRVCHFDGFISSKNGESSPHNGNEPKQHIVQHRLDNLQCGGYGIEQTLRYSGTEAESIRVGCRQRLRCRGARRRPIRSIVSRRALLHFKLGIQDWLGT